MVWSVILCDIEHLILDPDRREWEVRRVWLSPTKPPPAAPREKTQSGRLDKAFDGAERLLERYRAALLRWSTLAAAVGAAVVVLALGRATGQLVGAVVVLLVVAAAVMLPVWLGLLFLLIGQMVLYALGLFVLAGVVYGVMALVERPWLLLVILVLLVPALVWAARRPWTIEAVSWETVPGPAFRGMWWKVHGYRLSEEAFAEVRQALWRGEAESYRPAGMEGPRIVYVPGATRPPIFEP